MELNQPNRERQVALNGTQLERYHEQMQRYHRLLYRFSDGALPVMIRFSTLAKSNDLRMQGVNNMSNASVSSKEATIEALTLLQDKVAADIETLKRKTTENCEPSSAIAAVERGRQNSNVVGQESKRPAPLPSQANILPPINTRPPNLSLQVPSLGVSTKKAPRKVPPSSPVNENTPVKRTLDSAFEVHSVLPQDPIANEKVSASCGTHDSCKDTFHDSGTQCGRTQCFDIEDSGVPILESPVYVPSPIIESTPRKESNPAPSDTSSIPFQFESDAQVDERLDSGTQRSGSTSDLQSMSDAREASEASDDISESMDSDDSDYVDDASRKAKRKAVVKLKVIPETVEPASSTTTSSAQRIKRVCRSPERLDLKNVKSIKEERVFQRVPIDGAPVREETAALKTLQQCYGKGWKRKPGFKIHGYGDVVINPGGVAYKFEEKPVRGKDFFATAHDALAYCEANGIPRIQSPMAIDPAVYHFAINNDEEKAGNRDDDGVSSVNSDDVTEISQFEGYYQRCKCSSKANCHCLAKRG